MIVLGFQRNDFETPDGKIITGYNFYLGQELSGPDADGQRVERIYLSDKRLSESNYKQPSVGDDVIINYNRFGKPSGIYKIN